MNRQEGGKVMRVGYVFNHGDIVGGGEISFIDLVDAIQGFDVEPIAIVPGEGGVKSRLDTMRVKTTVMGIGSLRGLGILRFRSGIKRAARAFNELKLDLVHANGARCMLYTGPAARRVGIPCVWHVRVLDRDHILDRIRSHYADMIIANSLATSASLQAVLGQKEQTEVIYNGLEIDQFQTAAARDLHREIGIPAWPIVLGVGRFTRCKKFEDLIQACSLMQKKTVHFSLVLLGEALREEKEYEQELKQLAAQLGLRNAFFPGWRVDVAAIMKSASVLVLPSYTESFGRVILEAWACGLPVVATNVGGPAEIIKSGTDGLLVGREDVAAMSSAIERIITDNSLSQKLAHAGKKKVLEFSLDRHARQVASVYNRLLPSV